MTPHGIVPPPRPGTDEPARAVPADPGDRDVDVLVVGAAQAGLGTAYHLTRDPGLRVLVLDSAPVGRSWLDRWDSLTLFTPRRFSSLPGRRFPRTSHCRSRPGYACTDSPPKGPGSSR